MTALEKALSIYGAEEFSRLQRIYTSIGYTVTKPDLIAFFRVCNEENPDEVVSEGNAWFFELFVGNGKINQIPDLFPFPLPRAGWRRGFKGRDSIKFYDFNRSISILKNQ